MNNTQQTGAIMHNIKNKIIILAIAVFMVGWAMPALFGDTAYALPQDGAVAAGGSTITQPDGNTMHINQTTDKAIINWQGYSINANEAVKYFQPNGGSISLNRVTGADPSLIYGQLSANGQVWVINPNGMLIGQNAQINVGGFLASTLNITDQNFLNGNYNFTNTTTSLSSITNQGNINAADGGYVVFISPTINNSGSITANNGSVNMASGDDVTLTFANNGLINLVINKQTAADALGIDNSGTITADGGQVIISAQTAGDLLKTVINNTGVIQARTITNKDGVIRLEGGDNGIVAVSGTVDASGLNAGETGGTVQILGQHVNLVGASIDVSGDAGGGTVLIGGDFQGKGVVPNASTTYVSRDSYINADAVSQGDGGKVIVWSDAATQYLGHISARGGSQGGNGGFVEVSSAQSLQFNGFVDVSASNGVRGTFLLDPNATSGYAASLATNLFDYYPGQVVTITGSGFQAGETVSMVLHAGKDGLQDITLTSVADANGNFSNSSFSPTEQYRGVMVDLIALGQSSGLMAQTQFTDATITSTVTGGNWNATGTWTGGAVPVAADGVIIQGGATVTVDISTAAATTLTINNATTGSSTATLSFNIGSQLTVSSTLTLGGTGGNNSGNINMTSGGTLLLGAGVTVTNAGTWTVGTGTVGYNAAGAQTVNTTFLHPIITLRWLVVVPKRQPVQQSTAFFPWKEPQRRPEQSQHTVRQLHYNTREAPLKRRARSFLRRGPALAELK